MAEKGFDGRVENSNSAGVSSAEETGMNLFLDTYQPGATTAADNKTILNDATSINTTIRWFNDQYSKLGGSMGTPSPDVQDKDNKPKVKRLSITD